MTFSDGYGPPKALTPLVVESGIKEHVVPEAQAFAESVANFIHDPDHLGLIETFPPVPIDPDNGALIEGRLFMDYRESIGLKFADRTERPHLRSCDRAPLLVQMIEEKRWSL
jgi:hypothetical protein